MGKELVEIIVNLSLQRFDKHLLEEPIYERFLSKKERSISKKMRDILNLIPKNKRLEGIKEYLMSSDNDFIDD